MTEHMTGSRFRSFWAGRRAGAALALGALGLSAVVVVSGPTATLAAAPVLSDRTSAKACNKQAPQDVRVDGRQITLDGEEWRPKGLQIRAWVLSLEKVDPDKRLSPDQQAAKRSQKAFGPRMLGRARSVFGADMLRFQVSQPALVKDPAYTKKVKQAIALARCMGFVVNVSMQAQARAGTSGRTPIASRATQRAWVPMVRAFGNDRGVLLEIYNEPGLGGHPDRWNLWAHASEKGRTTKWPVKKRNKTIRVPIFGMQPMINYLRRQGSKNVLIVDGVELADTFEGYNLRRHGLKDASLKKRKNQILYAVHPYLRNDPANARPRVLDRNFGDLAKKKPVIVTEWSAKQCAGGLMLGDAKDYTSVVQLLNYLIRHRIPMSAGAFDSPGIMARNLTDYTPTNYDEFARNSKLCADGDEDENQKDRLKKNNAGLLVQKMFQEDYFAGRRGERLTPADGVTDPKWVP